MDWFLYGNGLRHERVKDSKPLQLFVEKRQFFNANLHDFAIIHY